MNEQDLLKKKPKPKPTLGDNGRTLIKKPWPTLGHIVLSNGSVVDIPKLPSSTSELTSYDHLRIALEHAGLAISCLNQLGSKMTPPLADTYNLAPIRLNLEDLLNHLYYAIEGYPSEKGLS